MKICTVQEPHQRSQGTETSPTTCRGRRGSCPGGDVLASDTRAHGLLAGGARGGRGQALEVQVHVRGDLLLLRKLPLSPGGAHVRVLEPRVLPVEPRGLRAGPRRDGRRPGGNDRKYCNKYYAAGISCPNDDTIYVHEYLFFS